jgi:hypothetical protein
MFSCAGLFLLLRGIGRSLPVTACPDYDFINLLTGIGGLAAGTAVGSWMGRDSQTAYQWNAREQQGRFMPPPRVPPGRVRNQRHPAQWTCLWPLLNFGVVVGKFPNNLRLWRKSFLYVSLIHCSCAEIKLPVNIDIVDFGTCKGVKTWHLISYGGSVDCCLLQSVATFHQVSSIVFEKKLYSG